MERKNKIKSNTGEGARTSGKTGDDYKLPSKKPSVEDLRPIRIPKLEESAKPGGRWTPPDRKKHRRSSKAYIISSIGVLVASAVLTVLGFLNLVPVTFGVSVGLLAMFVGLLMVIKIK